ncbi:MAG TPA: hypothetical protein VFU81_10210 [Thermomicrobiales bacterium]|nr:hypothetical protein [Thermomicrobiales bacterium]
MDAGRFDGFARSLARVRTRRAALRLTGGAVVAFGGAGASVAADAKQQRKKKCKNGTIRCNGQCCAADKVCIGGDCVSAQGTCAIGDNSCNVSAGIACSNPNSGGADCACYLRLQGGTRCVQFTLKKGACDQCKTDADCVALGFPKGSSCIRDDGPECNCNANARGYCGEPCGWVKTKAALATAAGPRR